MRAYKFLNESFGIKALAERRLKQSRIRDLNDPFELRPYELANDTLRNCFENTRQDMDADRGLVCFCENWHNPLMWAHYADRQKGLCLGFDMPDPDCSEDSDIMRVRYVRHPLQFPSDFDAHKEQLPFARNVLSTKFKDWAYEEEIRIWGPLQNEEGGIHFLNFDDRLRLAEVIIGRRSTLTRDAVVRVLGSLAKSVNILRAREDHSSFRMVPDDNF
jgi:hypothetical protein